MEDILTIDHIGQLQNRITELESANRIFMSYIETLEAKVKETDTLLDNAKETIEKQQDELNFNSLMASSNDLIKVEYPLYSPF